MTANALVSFYAAAALVQIDAQRAMPGIMSSSPSAKAGRGRRWRGFSSTPAPTSRASRSARSCCSLARRRKCRRSCPGSRMWMPCSAAKWRVELLRRHPDDAPIVAAALIVVLDPGVLPELARFAESTDADVRQNLAVAYGRLGGLGDTETVTRLMCDRVWWVRYRAGQALLRLKGMTPERLEAVRMHLTDKYARDMLEHVRAEAAIP